MGLETNSDNGAACRFCQSRPNQEGKHICINAVEIKKHLSGSSVAVLGDVDALGYVTRTINGPLAGGCKNTSELATAIKEALNARRIPLSRIDARSRTILKRALNSNGTSNSS